MEKLRHSPEMPTPKLDVLIVMGRNFLPGHKRHEIESTSTHLSPESRMNVWAAVLLYRAGLVGNILFSTGYTAGKDLPSEAQAMKNLFIRLSGISQDIALRVILPPQEETKSTDPESKEDARIVKEYGFRNVGVLTTGGDRDIDQPTGHIDRALWWFNKRGLDVTPLITEDILKDKFPRFVGKYLSSDLAQRVAKQERLASKIERSPIVGPLVLKTIAALIRK